MKRLPPIVGAIATGIVTLLIWSAICTIANDTITQPAVSCCTPRLQTVKADGTTWICLIEEDTAGVERHRSCQMSDMSEHIEK
nr:MAG TPA: hypothetical protein [Caudoviricetes sp.]